MPDSNIFPTLAANPFESRIGLQYYPSSGYFKLDAGRAVDIIRIEGHEGQVYSFGGSFAVQALGLNVKSKRLPIDAADGYFGFYFAYGSSEDDYYLRLRVLHNSAHLVDGHLERSTSYSSSMEYAKDFIELIFLKSNNSFDKFKFDYYAGSSYSVVISPAGLKRLSMNAGLQIRSEDIIGSLMNSKVNLVAAYNFSLTGIPEYIGNNSILAGLRFGEWEKSGLTIYLSYYSGGSLFNQYFNKREKEFSIGFKIE